MAARRRTATATTAFPGGFEPISTTRASRVSIRTPNGGRCALGKVGCDEQRGAVYSATASPESGPPDQLGLHHRRAVHVWVLGGAGRLYVLGNPVMVPFCNCPCCGGTGTYTSNHTTSPTATRGNCFLIYKDMRENMRERREPVFNLRFGPMWLFWVLSQRATPRDRPCHFLPPHLWAKKSTSPANARQRATRHVAGHAPRAGRSGRIIHARKRAAHPRPRKQPLRGMVARLMESMR